MNQLNNSLYFVDPGYPGPKIIQGIMRKVKQLDSVGRLFGDFNERYFTLDLNTLNFYYSKKKFVKLKEIRQICLSDIDLITDTPIQKINQKKQYGDYWTFPITIYQKTLQKEVLQLYACDSYEYKNWICGFLSILKKKDDFKPLLSIQNPLNTQFLQLQKDYLAYLEFNKKKFQQILKEQNNSIRTKRTCSWNTSANQQGQQQQVNKQIQPDLKKFQSEQQIQNQPQNSTQENNLQKQQNQQNTQNNDKDPDLNNQNFNSNQQQKDATDINNLKENNLQHLNSGSISQNLPNQLQNQMQLNQNKEKKNEKEINQQLEALNNNYNNQMSQNNNLNDIQNQNIQQDLKQKDQNNQDTNNKEIESVTVLEHDNTISNSQVQFATGERRNKKRNENFSRKMRNNSTQNYLSKNQSFTLNFWDTELYQNDQTNNQKRDVYLDNIQSDFKKNNEIEKNQSSNSNLNTNKKNSYDQNEKSSASNIDQADQSQLSKNSFESYKNNHFTQQELIKQTHSQSPVKINSNLNLSKSNSYQNSSSKTLKMQACENNNINEKTNIKDFSINGNQYSSSKKINNQMEKDIQNQLQNIEATQKLFQNKITEKSKSRITRREKNQNLNLNLNQNQQEQLYFENKNSQIGKNGFKNQFNDLNKLVQNSIMNRNQQKLEEKSQIQENNLGIIDSAFASANRTPVSQNFNQNLHFTNNYNQNSYQNNNNNLGNNLLNENQEQKKVSTISPVRRQRSSSKKKSYNLNLEN